MLSANGNDISGLMSISSTISIMDESGNPVYVENTNKGNSNLTIIIIGSIVILIVLGIIGLTIALIIKSARKRDKV